MGGIGFLGVSKYPSAHTRKDGGGAMPDDFTVQRCNYRRDGNPDVPHDGTELTVTLKDDAGQKSY